MLGRSRGEGSALPTGSQQARAGRQGLSPAPCSSPGALHAQILLASRNSLILPIIHTIPFRDERREPSRRAHSCDKHEERIWVPARRMGPALGTGEFIQVFREI